MNRLKMINKIRNKLSEGESSIGSWIQLSDSSVAEIMGQSGYDWVAVDNEHGSISNHQLPDIFRALELGDTLPLVRLAQGHPKDCKQALDAGAGGVIIPNVENAKQLKFILDACKWPPTGNRGVGFSRANLFGENFKSYSEEAQNPLIIAIIESVNGLSNLESILQIKALDAILIGPYDLSASLNITGDFENKIFLSAVDSIRVLSKKYSVASGIHIVEPKPEAISKRVEEGFQFIAYSVDSVFLTKSSKNPLK
jgi:2-dehydro-3-deoxyglucarate aldolase